MTYEAEVDLRNVNTSHAVLVELVGRNRRVLDVGCAGGYLGRVLAGRGCQVSGVELDPEAAEAAAKVLDDVLVGDVESLDLVGHFGKESFDVVVLGDVLEHLVDPAAALRKVAPLLTDTGSVVASVPNVAHGAVRLALLSGRFDYRPLGLLDATHLRFFTRESLHELFREAGLVPVDMRRTTAGVFETEIKVRREDFEQTVVDAVEGDPESVTYQFVLRAVPAERPEAAAPTAGAIPPAARTRVGVWAALDPDDGLAALEARVTVAELSRLMPGAFLRVFSTSPAAGPGAHDGGLPVERLGAWSTGRATVLTDQLDGAVVVGAIPAAGDPAANRFLLEGLAGNADGEVDSPVVWSAVRPADTATLDQLLAHGPHTTVVAGPAASGMSPGATVPDPLLLASRLLQPDALARRLEFVRMMGWYPREGAAAVVEAHHDLLPHAQAVAGALHGIVTSGAASVVLVLPRRNDEGAARAAAAVTEAMGVPCYLLPADSVVDDLLAVLAGAASVAAATPAVASVAAAYERPLAVLRLAGWAAGAGPLEDSVAVLREAGDLASLLDPDRVRPPDGLAARQARLDTHFHYVASLINGAAAARPRPPGPPTLPPPEYVAAMETAYLRMRERLVGERRAVAEQLGRLHGAYQGELRQAWADIERLQAERAEIEGRLDQVAGDSERRDRMEAELRARADRAERDLEALQNIRILRALRPARAIYARLRGHRL